ncbi:MAG: HlyC/CorC family transporter [Phycisphaerales bacterium]|nr:HlyC/CorC family transporter [Phycisphaerales bacterium]
MLPLILYFLLALVVSFVCSLLEAIILSLDPGHVEKLARDKRRSGLILKRLRSHLDRPLAAILTMNTVANVVGSAGVGAEAGKQFGQEALGIAAAILTVCILIGSEIIPKALGATYARPLAPFAAYAIQGLIILLYPFVAVLRFISRHISSRAAIEGPTLEEIHLLAELGARAGTIQSRETRIIANILRLNAMQAADVMTPRVEVFALQKDRKVGEIARSDAPIRFSRIPIYAENRDEIIGIVLRSEIYKTCFDGHPEATLESIRKPVHFVPETQSIARLLETFIDRREHVVLVVNEYGGTEGLVTLEDAIETLLGVEIVDELDSVEDLRKLALQKLTQRRQLRHTHQDAHSE